MDDRELNESLRRLPEVRPGDGFTAEVLARVERFERTRTAAARGGAAARWRPTLLAAGLAAALVAAVGVWQPWDGGRAPEDRGEFAAPMAAGAERLDEGSRGGSALGGEGTGVLAERDERLDAGRSGAGGDGTAMPAPVPGAEDDAAGTSGARRIPGDRLAARVDAASPRRSAPPPAPLAEGVPPATAANGDALATAPVARETLAAADTPAAPGADFFAAPPAGRPAAASAAERLARLREERDRLARGLAAFRSQVPPAEPPVVVLDGGEGLDLVFDLGRWAAQPPAETPAAARPAVHSTQGPPRRF